MARTYAEWFEVPFENVRLVSPYIGGGFGSKALALSHSAVAASAAKMLGRPVKLVMTRPQTFTGYGGRAATRQTVTIGADHVPEAAMIGFPGIERVGRLQHDQYLCFGPASGSAVWSARGADIAPLQPCHLAEHHRGLA